MTATPATGGVPAAGAGGHQQHRVLQQQEEAVYTEDPAAAAVATLEAAAPPSDAASTLAAALGQPVADGLADADVPAAAAQGVGSADAAPSSLSEQQQASGANSQQPSDLAYNMFETPAAASAEQQHATVTQLQPEQQQHPPPQQEEQLPASPPAAAEEEDQSTNPPNDNSELLPPEAAQPPAPQPPPTANPPPADGGDGGDGDSSSGNEPATPEPPQTLPGGPGLDTHPWLNPSLPLSERISSLLKALTLEEKIPMMIHGQAGVPRLSLKPFQFWTGRWWGGGAVGHRVKLRRVAAVASRCNLYASTWEESASAPEQSLHARPPAAQTSAAGSPALHAPCCSVKQQCALCNAARAGLFTLPAPCVCALLRLPFAMCVSPACRVLAWPSGKV